MPDIRKESCTACPYRRDVPSGVWAASEYEKLAEYDRETFDQPLAAFYCHATPEVYCHGWAVVGEKVNERDHGRDLFALRLAGLQGHFNRQDPMPQEGAPLFDSHTEACEHGKRDIEHPSQEALDTVARLQGKYERLRFS